jgi:hypothetical protein
MKDKLILEHDRNSGVWRISWRLADEQEKGATLGKGYWDVVEDDKEHYVAQNAAFNTPGVEQDSAGFFWDNKKLARAALKMCKEALKKTHLLARPSGGCCLTKASCP